MSVLPNIKIHALIVAAGVGKRFGSDRPKQYTLIHGKTVLQHSVDKLSQVDGLQDCYLVVAQDDNTAKTLDFAMPVHYVIGGVERMHSVYHGVEAIWQQSNSTPTDKHWVLIHDAARPCVNPTDIQQLINQTTTHPIGKVAGGLLAVPVRDTVKQARQTPNEVLSQNTLNRSELWLAQTPQLFPLTALRDYLTQAIHHNIAFTDETSLFEHFGHTPLLVEGSHSNIKLTFAEDQIVATTLLSPCYSSPCHH